MAKKTKEKKKAMAKKTVRTAQRLEIVVRSENAPVVPTTQDLAEPMRDGKKLTIPKTWMTENQLTFMLQRTPRNQVYRRAGRGGQAFDYVTGSYMQKALNYIFGWNWDFEIVEHGKEADHVWVLGKLTVRGTKTGEQITKTQFGRSEVKKLKSGSGYVDYGNDLKAAATDAMKKCASMLGLASDIYSKTEYTQESGEKPQDAPVAVSPKTHPATAETIKYPDPVYLCKNCGIEVSEQEQSYSLKVFKKILCRECQKETK